LHFELQQYLDELLVQRIVNARPRQRVEVLEIEKVFQAAEIVLITLTSGPTGSAVYINGRKVKDVSQQRLAAEDLAGPLVIGTSPTHSSPWQGELLGMALYNQQLGDEEVAQGYLQWKAAGAPDERATASLVSLYRFDERAGRASQDVIGNGPALNIPARYVLPNKPILARPPLREMRRLHFWADVAVNIGGFMPLGFFLCVYFSLASVRNPVIVAIAGGLLLSFTIELLQIWLPLRDSDATDIVTNFTGTAIGAAFFLSLRPQKKTG
jgi:VanZ family protein